MQTEVYDVTYSIGNQYNIQSILYTNGFCTFEAEAAAPGLSTLH